ncbi:MAG: FUSC family protein [Actinobacteria bacterium]|nr:FUSC family protein [Actinomycetota bacterium]
MRSALRSRVADALTASANLIHAIWPDPGAPLPSTVDIDTRIRELSTAHHNLREQYDGQPLRPGGATARDRALMQLIDELSRLRLFLKWRSEPEVLVFPPNVRLASTTATTLAECAAAIHGDSACPDPNQISAAREHHRNAAETFATEQLKAGRSADIKDVVDTGFQLRIAALFSEIIARNTRVATGSKPARHELATGGVSLEVPEPTPGRILRSNLTLRSPWMRNSLRAGLALAIAIAVVAFTQVDHGFWVALGTIAALRLDVVGTTKTALRAIIGTTAGFAIGSAILFALGNQEIALWILFPVAVFLSAYTPAVMGVAVGQASITIFVIVLYSIIIGPTFKTGQDRVIDVAIGLAISLFVSLLMWPRGVSAKMRESLSTSISASTDYMVATYGQLTGGDITTAEFDAAHTRAATAGTTAYETFDQTLSQARSNPAQIAAWAFMVNASGHIRASADLIAWIDRSGRSPRGCPAYNASLLAAAEFVRARIDTSTEMLGQAFDTDRASAVLADDALMHESTGQLAAVPGDPFGALDESVKVCLAGFEGDQADRGIDPGANAISTVWAQDWLIHLNWVADQVALVTRRAAVASDGAEAAASSPAAETVTK